MTLTASLPLFAWLHRPARLAATAPEAAARATPALRQLILEHDPEAINSEWGASALMAMFPREM